MSVQFNTIIPQFSTNNTKVLNGNGQLVDRRPSVSPSGYIPTQPVINGLGQKVITSNGNQLYTNGIKTGTDFNYINETVYNRHDHFETKYPHLNNDSFKPKFPLWDDKDKNPFRLY